MSDASQGEGWWLASDGKWYPPEAGAAAPIGAADAQGPAPTSPPFASPGAGGGAVAPPGAAPGGQASGSGGGGAKVAVVGIVALLVGLLVGGGIAFAVGGSDDADGSGEWEAFCDEATELEALEESGDEPSDAEAAALFDELVDAAPDRYQDTLAPLGDMLGDETSDDMDAFGTAFTSVFWLVGVLEVECGITDESGGMFGGGDLSLDGDLGFDVDDDSDPFEDDPFEDDPFEDDPFEDDEEDGPMSIDTMQAYLDDNHDGEAWLDAIGSWSVSNEKFVSIAPTTDALSDDEAMEACEALSAYVYDVEPDGSVTVTTPDGTAQAESEAGGPCELVASGAAAGSDGG